MSAEHGGVDKDGRRNKKRALIVIVSIVAAAGVGSLAFAYWTQGGSGTGSAAAGSTSAVHLNQTNVVSGLYPDGPAKTLTGTIDNPNPGHVHVTSVSASITSVTGGGSGALACTAADFAFSNPVVGNGGDVLPGNGGGTFSIDIQMIDTGVNQDLCKNAQPQITYTAS